MASSSGEGGGWDWARGLGWRSVIIFPIDHAAETPRSYTYLETAFGVAFSVLAADKHGVIVHMVALSTHGSGKMSVAF